MKNLFILRFMLIWILTIVLFIGNNNYTYAQNNVKTIVKDNNAFAVSLYSQLKKQKGNIFFSPYSISTALSMVYAGAKNKTEDQMANTLHFNLPQLQIHPAFNLLAGALKSSKDTGSELNIANSLWVQQDYKFLSSFMNTIKANYGAVLFNVNFKTSYEKIRVEINTWVEKQTNAKITNLIPSGILNNLTRMVLVNAIYFNGLWKYQFNKNNIQTRPFKLISGEKINVQMMYQKENFKYVKQANLKLIELPYKDNKLSMLIILPENNTKLSEVENLITINNINLWVASLKEEKVTLYLPKFKLTSLFKLNEALSSMGMVDAFSPKADFSGLDGTKNLSISAVLHKAFINVDEKGTEAAAATAVVMHELAMPEDLIIFNADHPFIFLIRHNNTGSILFIGRVMNPNKSD